MNGTNYRIIACGEVLWDLFPEGPRFGGAPANFACHASLLGATVYLGSAVGEDARGSEALDILRRFGVDTTLVQTVADAPTGSVGVNVDAAGKPSYEIHAGAAWDRFAATDALERCLGEADAFYFGTLGQRDETTRATIRHALGIARARNLPRVLDVNLRKPFYDDELIRDSVEQASVLKISDEELPEVASACGIPLEAEAATTLRALLRQYRLDLVAMTCGPDGAILVSPDEVVKQPGIPTIVRDTVGAGDSFTAALTLGLLRGDRLRDIARATCEIASAVCAQPGAVPEPEKRPSQ